MNNLNKKINYKKLHNKKLLKYYLNNPDKYLEDFNEIRAIQFELSSRCNLRCSFCSHQFKKNTGADMPYVKALEYLDKLPGSINFIHLHFSGEAFAEGFVPSRTFHPLNFTFSPFLLILSQL